MQVSDSTPRIVGRDDEDDGSVFRVRKSGKEEFTMYWEDEDTKYVTAGEEDDDEEALTVSERSPLRFKLSYYRTISDWQAQPCHVEVTTSPKSYLGYDKDEEVFKIVSDVDIKKTKVTEKKWLQFTVKKLPVDKDGKVNRAPRKTKRSVPTSQNVNSEPVKK